MKKRTPHYLMKEAILEHVQREEARQNFIKAAETSFEHYKETGLHITLDEFSAWVDEAQQKPDTPTLPYYCLEPSMDIVTILAIKHQREDDYRQWVCHERSLGT